MILNTGVTLEGFERLDKRKDFVLDALTLTSHLSDQSDIARRSDIKPV